MANTLRLVGAATVVLVGCAPPTTSTVDQSEPAAPAATLSKVTFYVPGMNQRLQIL